MHGIYSAYVLPDRQCALTGSHQKGRARHRRARAWLALVLVSPVFGCDTTASERDGEHGEVLSHADDQADTGVVGDASLPSAARAAAAEAGEVDVCNRQLVDISPSAASAQIPCVFELRIDLASSKAVHVLIDEQELLRGQGWTLQGQKVVLDTACDLLRDARPHRVELRQDCLDLISL